MKKGGQQYRYWVDYYAPGSNKQVRFCSGYSLDDAIEADNTIKIAHGKNPKPRPPGVFKNDQPTEGLNGFASFIERLNWMVNVRIPELERIVEEQKTQIESLEYESESLREENNTIHEQWANVKSYIDGSRAIAPNPDNLN